MNLRQRFCVHDWTVTDRTLACRYCELTFDELDAYHAKLSVRGLRWASLPVAALLGLVARLSHIEPWHDIAVCLAAASATLFVFLLL